MCCYRFKFQLSGKSFNFNEQAVTHNCEKFKFLGMKTTFYLECEHSPGASSRSSSSRALIYAWSISLAIHDPFLVCLSDPSLFRFAFISDQFRVHFLPRVECGGISGCADLHSNRPP